MPALTILRLLEKIPDKELREQILTQYYVDVEAQADLVQGRIGEFEISISDKLTTAFGNTNIMISEVVGISRESSAGLEALRQTTESGFRSIDTRVGVVETRIDSIGESITQFDNRISQVEESLRRLDKGAQRRINLVNDEIQGIKSKIIGMEEEMNTRKPYFAQFRKMAEDFENYRNETHIYIQRIPEHSKKIRELEIRISELQSQISRLLEERDRDTR